jgi:hypothetical protein
MRDYKTLGIRVNKHEALAVRELAAHEGISVSELIRRWLLLALLHHTKGSPFAKAS